MDKPDAEDASTAVGSSCETALPGGSFFSQAQNFEISGGTFTSVTNIAYPTRSDFRMIPLGDIDLQDGIRQAVYRPQKRTCVRRMYSARIGMQKSPMTAELYMGEDAEKEWVRQISKYSRFRHPNLMQIFCAASSTGLYATIFHDGLTPLEDFVEKAYDPSSPLLAIYIKFSANKLFDAIWDAFTNRYRMESKRRLTTTAWFRSTTGRICLDFEISFGGLQPSHDNFAIANTIPHNPTCFFEPQPESTILSALPLTIDWKPSRQWGSLAGQHHYFSISSLESVVHLGAVLDTTLPGGPPFKEVALWSDNRTWLRQNFDGNYYLKNGWARCTCREIENLVTWVSKSMSKCNFWMNQANSIFSRLQITANHENYVLVDNIGFCLLIEETRKEPPEGYLFLCPASDFQVGPLAFRWPACPSYWSLDETGEERLSEEDALRLGFPAISYKTEIHGLSWGSDTYAMVSKLHRSKGFDPESQDVARHLNEPLYQLPDELVSAPFAHIVDETSGEYERQTAESVVGEENLRADEDSGVFDPSESTLACPHIKNLDFNYEEYPVLPADHEWLEILKFSFILLNALLALLYH